MPKMPDKIHISQLIGAESINKINSDLEKFLSNKGFYVTHSQIPTSGEVLIQHFYNAYIIERVGHRFKKRILIQPIDGNVLRKDVVDAMNTFDLIITPSISCKNIFINNGIKKPIVIIPNYYDDSILESDNRYYDKNYASSKYTFYSESTGIKRKNLVNILKNFLIEFKAEDNVRLILKITTKNNRVIDELNDMFNQYSANSTSAPEVVIINEFLSVDNLNSLRRGIDCYVCLSYMEGFCIPLLNSVVLKKDVICLDTEISGYADFVNKDNSYLINSEKVSIEASVRDLAIYSPISQWEKADYIQYRKALRSIYNKEYIYNKDINDYSKYSQEFVMNQYLKIISE